MNVRDELLAHVFSTGKTVKCAIVIQRGWHSDDENITCLLPEKPDVDDWEAFCRILDFDSDASGIEGTIWYTCDSWSERWEYDSTGGWEMKSKPIIPKELRK